MKFNLKNLIFLGLLFFSSEDSVLAQLVPDRTLGIESSTVVPVSSTKKNIEGGATRGTNIFHSFQEFNVNTGQKVFFNNPSGIKNIINRVTGKNISNISGTLGVNGNANLYLINPNGIIFGNGAKLDINGSFIGTTADGIKLGENDIFSATDPANSRLLTIEPGALFVNESRSVKSIITNEGNLEINPGAKIILSGDEITNNGLINSFGGDIFIEAVNGNINITQNINASALRDIQNNPVANGGDIYLKANKNITFNSGVQIRSSGILGGNINIQSNKNLRLIDGASARTITSSENTGGNLQVSAKKIELIGANSNTSSPSLLLVINSGNKASIKINTDELNLIDGGTISIDSPNRIDGGNIEILAKKIEIIGINKFTNLASGIFLNLDRSTLKITSNSLRLTNGGQIGTSNFRDRQGGTLNINAKIIELIGKNPINNQSSGLFSSTFDFLSNNNAIGNGGNINVNVTRLIIEDGGTINVSNFSSDNQFSPGLGRAGNINIKSNETLLNRGTITADGNVKGGGNITIDSSKFILLKNESKISTNVGQTIEFPGGNLTINSPFVVALSKDNEFTATAISSQGGNININTKAIFGYPQNLKIDASSQLGIDGTVNINGLTNEFNKLIFESENISVEQDKIPELKKCPLQYGLNKISLQSESNREIPATVGACKNERGNVVIF